MEQSSLSFKELAEKLDIFDQERRWTNLSPEDLAKSIMLEWAELLEHFQWDSTLRNRWNVPMEKNIEEMRYEAADILIYLMKFCRETQINIIELTLKKLEKLQKKYPVGYNDTKDDTPNHEAYLKIKKAYRENK